MMSGLAVIIVVCATTYFAFTRMLTFLHERQQDGYIPLSTERREMLIEAERLERERKGEL